MWPTGRSRRCVWLATAGSVGMWGYTPVGITVRSRRIHVTVVCMNFCLCNRILRDVVRWAYNIEQSSSIWHKVFSRNAGLVSTVFELSSLLHCRVTSRMTDNYRASCRRARSRLHAVLVMIAQAPIHLPLIEMKFVSKEQLAFIAPEYHKCEKKTFTTRTKNVYFCE